MRIGVVGAGRIGGGAARRWVLAGHEVLLSGRDAGRAADLARELGAAGAPPGPPAPRAPPPGPRARRSPAPTSTRSSPG